MITESIILIIFVCSFGGVLFILARKIPALNLLPQNGSIGIKKGKFITKIENRIKDISIFFEKQIFLHKFLSWVKMIVIKIETTIDILLQRIRKKSQQIDKELKDKRNNLPK